MSDSQIPASQANVALHAMRRGSINLRRFLTEGTAGAFADAIGADSVTFGELTSDKQIPYRATFADGSQLRAEIGISG